MLTAANSNLFIPDICFFHMQVLAEKNSKSCEKGSIHSNFCGFLSGDGLEKLLGIQCCSDTPATHSCNFFSVKHACNIQGKFLLFYIYSQLRAVCNV